ncbi:hypothetical protein NDU88_001877 [Pleurodeles waltl]|uniref:Uncharacterized protein n=1 Tax=Pleurodeles waltl TaxID=8319 RepID=A0AAV7S8U8_PLEWA|nr:hypothetical protein NDU88_001877 [Pleurodeles waltl]
MAARQTYAATWLLRGGHSDLPAGPAGTRQGSARQPSGKGPATQKPAPNGAGGVAGVRRVQLQTVKIMLGPC